MFTHWYCRAYDKYADNEKDLKFDQHLFVSCIAPRALLVEGFDNPWYDTESEFMCLQAASPVWEWSLDFASEIFGKQSIADLAVVFNLPPQEGPKLSIPFYAKFFVLLFV